MEQKKKLNIELGEKESEGIYSNLVLLVHSPSEIIFDFARMMPGVPKTKLYARIIMTPQHAKMFLKNLEESIKNFENEFGKINIPDKPDTQIGFQKEEKG
jgi:hypothetical protein